MAMSASDNGVRRDPLLPILELPGHCPAVIAVIGPAFANGNGVWIAQNSVAPARKIDENLVYLLEREGSCDQINREMGAVQNSSRSDASIRFDRLNFR
jgi:hypothetical protein